MTKTKKNKKSKKKGFTLVELLAVIIILAIVVGITIPAVLTTTNKTKEKAFKTAAQSVANWVDRQYEVYSKGLSDYEVATVDTNFENLCLRACTSADHTSANTEANSCYCDARVNYLTSNFIVAAGLQIGNIHIKTDNYLSLVIGVKSNTKGYLMKPVKDTVTATNTDTKINNCNSGALNNANCRYPISGDYDTSRVYINPQTGKSCVTLKASEDGDYPANSVVCGGTCQSTEANKPDYCKSTL